MKIVKSICSILVVAIIALVCFFSNNVQGTWHYAMSDPGSIEVPILVQVFPWVGADQLPDDVVGEDHQGLIDKILNGTYTETNGSVTQIGLNNPDSYISEEIKKRANGNFLFRSDVLGSMDFWESSDISKFFDTATNGLSFLLYFPEGESDVYYLYTTSVELGKESNNPNIPIGEKIYPIYRTELHKDETGKWVATETRTGYAESAYYQNPITGSWLVKYPSFDPNSWEEVDLGLSFNDAIYAFVGQTTTSYNKDATTPTYYKLTTSSATTINISSEDENAIIKVYDSSKRLVTATKGAQGSPSVSFRSSRNATYYLEVSGGKSITFAIK